jgi:cullin-associated NEDD8-dissociated protein 1
VVESLCQNIDSDQDRLRDVSSIALKTVVNELSLVQHAKQISLIIAKVLPKLLNNLSKSIISKIRLINYFKNLLINSFNKSFLEEEKRTDSSIKIEIADILGIIVAKFGRQNDINFNAVEDVLFLLIKRERQALRKRAITVLGYLVGTVQDEAYERIALRVLEGLKTEKDPNALRAYVLAAATISKSSTRLFVGHLAEVGFNLWGALMNTF